MNSNDLETIVRIVEESDAELTDRALSLNCLRDEQAIVERVGPPLDMRYIERLYVIRSQDNSAGWLGFPQLMQALGNSNESHVQLVSAMCPTSQCLLFGAPCLSRCIGLIVLEGLRGWDLRLSHADER